MLGRIRKMWRMRSNRESIYSRPNFWNKKAELYEGTAVSMFVNIALNEHYQKDQFRFFNDALGRVDGRDVLDVGCGTGRLSRHLASQGAKVVAFDFAQQAIDIAWEESHGFDISFSVRSVFDLQEVDRYDDIVVLGCLSAACVDQKEFVRVIHRLHDALRSGGRLVMIEPFHAGFLHRVLRLSNPEVKEIMKAVGFDIYMTRELHFWPVRLLLTLGNIPAFLTTPIYFLGETFMKLISSFVGSGDYKGIAAVRVP